MKRNSNIIQLSRDHHYGLLFCWKIRRGLTNAISLERIRPYVHYFWQHNLEEHFSEEESLLFRNMRDPLCLRALEEHRNIKGLVWAIMGNGAWIRSNYTGLADLVEQHIRFEERQVFPYLEQRLTREQLSLVGAQLSRLHALPADDLYEDAFWD